MMMTLTSPRLVGMISLREISGSSAATMPAAFSSGAVSSKIRPFDRATLMLMSDNIPLPSMGAPDARTQLTQLFFDAFITPVQMVDTVNHRLAFGNQSGEDQARRSAQIGGHDSGSLQGIHPVHDRRIAFHLDVGPQTAQLLHMHETIFEDRFRNHRSTLRHAVERHELCLHVGGKGRIRRGAQAYGLEASIGRQPYPVVALLDMRAGFLQFADNRVQDIRTRA